MKSCGIVLCDALDKLIGEVLAVEIKNLGVGLVLFYLVNDSADKVSFSKTAGAVNKQRIIIH